jgi:hypothetical protein
MDEMMLEILRKQKHKDQKEDKAFSSKAYRKVITKINEIFSLNISMKKVYNHFKTFKEQMILAKEIELKRGIGWNDTFKTIESPTKV